MKRDVFGTLSDMFGVVRPVKPPLKQQTKEQQRSERPRSSLGYWCVPLTLLQKRLNKAVARISVIDRGLCGGPHIGTRNKFPKAAQPRFSPISGPFWVRVGVRARVSVRVRVRVRTSVRGWVGSNGIRRVRQLALGCESN